MGDVQEGPPVETDDGCHRGDRTVHGEVSEAFHALEPDVLEALKEAALQTKQEATSDKALQAA